MSDVNYQEAPNFTLDDLNGSPVTLADYKFQRNVLLVFNRSFY
jgi:peroxiredoxin